MDWVQISLWLVVFLGIAGNIANVKKKWWCFVLWDICNLYLIVYNFYRQEYAQSFLFLVYFVIATWGLISWFRDKRV